MNIKKQIFILIILFSFLNNCTFSKIQNVNGIHNLLEKIEKLIININNKDDTISIIGYPNLIDFKSDDTWIYYEIRETANLYGQKKLLKNDIAILIFDNNNLLTEKKILTKDQMNELEFSNKITISKGIDNSLLKDLLASSRKRIENLQKKK